MKKSTYSFGLDLIIFDEEWLVLMCYQVILHINQVLHVIVLGHNLF